MLIFYWTRLCSSYHQTLRQHRRLTKYCKCGTGLLVCVACVQSNCHIQRPSFHSPQALLLRHPHGCGGIGTCPPSCLIKPVTVGWPLIPLCWAGQAQVLSGCRAGFAACRHPFTHALDVNHHASVSNSTVTESKVNGGTQKHQEPTSSCETPVLLKFNK